MTHAASHALSALAARGRPDDDTVGDPGLWDAYRDLGLTAADLPGLARLARVVTDDDAPEPACYTSIHAWRAMVMLGEPEAVPHLLDVMDVQSAAGDEWAIEDLPQGVAHLGPPALPHMVRFLPDQRRDAFARGALAVAMASMPERFPETRAEIVKAIVSALSLARFNDPATNALFIVALLEVRAPETLPAIKKAYDLDSVEEDIVGPYEDVVAEMALPHGQRLHGHDHGDDCGCGHDHG